MAKFNLLYGVATALKPYGKRKKPSKIDGLSKMAPSKFIE